VRITLWIATDDDDDDDTKTMMYLTLPSANNYLLDGIRVVDNRFQHIARLGKVFLHVRLIGANYTNSQTWSYELHTHNSN